LNVLKLLAQGLGTIAIAEQLGIDPRSVQNYITTLRRKIGCDARIQLVDWYKRMYGGEGA
jgi:DNA-binding NarL/FixJ family response regulator